MDTAINSVVLVIPLSLDAGSSRWTDHCPLLAQYKQPHTKILIPGHRKYWQEVECSSPGPAGTYLSAAKGNM